MGVNEIIHAYSQNMPPEKKEIFDAVAVLCQSITADSEDFYKKYQEALNHYKNKEYSMLKKSLDSFLGHFDLTTTPKDCGKMQRGRFSPKNAGNQAMNMQLADLDKIIQRFLDEKEGLQKQLDLAKNETNRLASEVNEANAKLSSLIRSKKEDDEKRNIYLQKMLAELGRDGTVKENSALALMMDEYEYSFSWDFEKQPEWFNSYIVSDSARTGIKMPAILKEEKLSQKGLAYVLETKKAPQDGEEDVTTE